jgi:hypothetical protein
MFRLFTPSRRLSVKSRVKSRGEKLAWLLDENADD